MDGLQLPAMPLSEVVGSVGTPPPAHMVKLLPKLNVGIAFAVTVTVNATGPVTHCPAEGVNVYVPEF